MKLKGCDDHLKPDEMLHNIDSKIVSLQVIKIKITDPAASTRQEMFQNSKSRTNLFITTVKRRQPRRHNGAAMVNEPYLHSADDGPMARNRSAI